MLSVSLIFEHEFIDNSISKTKITANILVPSNEKY